MVGVALLEVYIRDSGLKKSYLADKLNISRTSFCNKLSGKTPFNVGEIKTLIEILDIESNDDKVKIFLT